MIKEQKNQYSIILAALIHDIGKFAWRANSDQFLNHEKLSEEFFQLNVKCNSLFRDDKEFSDQVEKNIVHHSVYSKISGGDRFSAKERSEDNLKQPRRPLLSLFQSIDIGKGKDKDSLLCYSPNPITNTPVTLINDIELYINKNWIIDEAKLIEIHKKYYDEFCIEVKNIYCNDLISYTNTFYSLLEKYTSRVCSAGYKSRPDISLFDHSRMTAAFALINIFKTDDAKPFLIIQADISGIQNFIYKMVSGDSVGSKRRAKRLRGRSFYINLLTETVAGIIIDKLNLFRANILFSGGGHFIILACNNIDSKNMIADIEKNVNKFLYKKFKGDLGIIISYLEAGDEIIEDFSGVMRNLAIVNSNAKKTKFHSILTNIFTNKDDLSPATYDVCPICQANEEKEFIRKYGQCHSCEEHTSTGKLLCNSEYLIRVHAKGLSEKFIKDFGILSFSEFGIFWIVCKQNDLESVFGNFYHEQIEKIDFIRINNTDFLKYDSFVKSMSFPINYSYQFIGNFAPSQKGEPLEFEEIAELNTDNYPLLGVLRMDVDNLGKIFSEGFGEDKSISRIATVSREMNLFFLGYINKIAEKHHIYIAYSGGDDIFAVGSWINSLNFALAVRDEFRKFTCSNPNFSISGGIYMCKENYPIGKAAELSGDEEHKAKEKNEDKDSLAIFGEVIKWSELIKHLEYAKNMLELVKEYNPHVNEKNEVSRGFIYSIYEQSKLMKDEKGDFNLENLKKYLAKIHYSIARKGVTNETIKIRKEDNMKVELLYRLLEPEIQAYFPIIASYILLKTRNKGE